MSYEMHQRSSYKVPYSGHRSFGETTFLPTHTPDLADTFS